MKICNTSWINTKSTIDDLFCFHKELSFSSSAAQFFCVLPEKIDRFHPRAVQIVKMYIRRKL